MRFLIVSYLFTFTVCCSLKSLCWTEEKTTHPDWIILLTWVHPTPSDQRPIHAFSPSIPLESDRITPDILVFRLHAAPSVSLAITLIFHALIGMQHRQESTHSNLKYTQELITSAEKRSKSTFKFRLPFHRPADTKGCLWNETNTYAILEDLCTPLTINTALNKLHVAQRLQHETMQRDKVLDVARM